ETQRAITRVLAEKLRALNARVREHPAEEDRPWRGAAPAGDPLRDVPRSSPLPAWRSFFPRLPFFERFDAFEIEELAARRAVREPAWLLELPASEFLAQYQGNSKLQHAIHLSLLRSLARTNTQLTRLISHARLAAAEGEARKLEAALHGQLWRPQEM